MVFGVLVERRRAADAICLHDPTLTELRKKFCFPETKKCDFCIFLGQPNVGFAWTQMNTDKTKELNHRGTEAQRFSNRDHAD
jgi:hypothetical protein